MAAHVEDRAARRLTVALWAVVAGGLLVVRLAGPVVWAEPFTSVRWVMAVWALEVWVVLGLVWWVAGRVRVGEVLVGAQRIVAVLLAGGLLVAQLWPLRVDEYPFTTWDMYTMPVDEVPYTEFRLLADGARRERLPIADLVPNTMGRAFMARVTPWVQRAADGDVRAEAVVTETLRALLDDLDDPAVDGVEVRGCRVAEPDRRQAAACETWLVVAR